jgi:hypothetical protein
MRGGHFVDVDEVSELSDEKAIAKAHALFSERKDLFEGFELWDRERVLVGHPELFAQNNPPSGGFLGLEMHSRSVRPAAMAM